MYKNGVVAILAILPSELTMNELPSVGGDALLPVVQYISVDVLLTSGQSMPSIVTVTVVPNPVPTICITSPPTLAANLGLTDDTTDVPACEYVTAPVNTLFCVVTTTSHTLSTPDVTDIVLYLIPYTLI